MADELFFETMRAIDRQAREVARWEARFLDSAMRQQMLTLAQKTVIIQMAETYLGSHEARALHAVLDVTRRRGRPPLTSAIPLSPSSHDTPAL